MMAGVESLRIGSTFRREDLVGDCSDATHVVSKIYVGGFGLAAGETRDLEGGASVFVVPAVSVGGGAKSESAIEHLQHEGSAKACEEAQDKGTPSPQCSVPLRVALMSLAAPGGSATAAPSAPPAAAPSAPAAPVEQRKVDGQLSFGINNRLPKTRRLDKLGSTVDGNLMYNRQDDSGALANIQEVPIFNGSVAAGDHVLLITFDAKDTRGGSPLQKTSSHSITVRSGKPIVVTAAILEAANGARVEWTDTVDGQTTTFTGQ
jgi:hypothetical protein